MFLALVLGLKSESFYSNSTAFFHQKVSFLWLAIALFCKNVITIATEWGQGALMRARPPR